MYVHIIYNLSKELSSYTLYTLRAHELLLKTIHDVAIHVYVYQQGYIIPELMITAGHRTKSGQS